MSHIDPKHDPENVYPQDGVTDYKFSAISKGMQDLEERIAALSRLVEEYQEKKSIIGHFSKKPKCDCGVGTDYPAGTPHWITCKTNQHEKPNT